MVTLSRDNMIFEPVYPSWLEILFRRMWEQHREARHCYLATGSQYEKCRIQIFRSLNAASTSGFTIGHFLFRKELQTNIWATEKAYHSISVVIKILKFISR
jgi:hypothetical protein